MTRALPAFARALLVTLALAGAMPALAQEPPTRARPLIVLDETVIGALSPATRALFLDAIRPAVASVDVLQGAAAVRRFGEAARDGAMIFALMPPADTVASDRPAILICPPPTPGPIIVVGGVVVPREIGRDVLVNREDIRSVEIIRGAEAARLYGWRAVQGVIVITTNARESD